MPGFDGTGPLGKGPMTGRALGYCVLKEPVDQTDRPGGVASIDSVPVDNGSVSQANLEKEVIQMPLGDGTGPAGMGPMTGRAAGFCAGYPVPGYRNPAVFGGWRATPYGAPAYGAGTGYPAIRTGWFGRWFGGGLGMGRGFGRGRGRRRGRAGLRYY